MRDHAADYNFSGRFLAMRAYGEVLKTACPVCGSGDIFNAWKIPMTRIDPPALLFGGYFDQAPTLQSPFQIFGFDFCRKCESIFLNPDVPREQLIRSYVESTSYIPIMSEKAEWEGYRERYADLLRIAPAGAGVLVDAGCGFGQILFIARDDSSRVWRRAVGLELSSAYVNNMNEKGLEAYQFDLDRDDHRQIVPPGSADIVSFFEAFEHVQRPLGALARMLDMTRPGGRVHFTAQRYGPDVQLAIRPGEPIYIGPHLLKLLPELLPCTVFEAVATGSRYFITLERTQAPLTENHLRLGESSSPHFLAPQGSAVEEKVGDAATSVVVSLARPFDQDTGHCFIARLRGLPHAATIAAMTDGDQFPRRSRIRLIEEGRELGPAHAQHKEIREIGRGRYSHWGADLYFSTSDGSDPNANGLIYTIEFDAT